MKTQENNKLIAEFMGRELQDDSTDRWYGSYREPNGILHKNTNKEPLLFHTSWDWLIPVVQKLIDVYVSIDEQDEQNLQQSVLYDKIDSVYQITLEIIEKYNSEDRG